MFHLQLTIFARCFKMKCLSPDGHYQDKSKLIPQLHYLGFVFSLFLTFLSIIFSVQTLASHHLSFLTSVLFSLVNLFCVPKKKKKDARILLFQYPSLYLPLAINTLQTNTVVTSLLRAIYCSISINILPKYLYSSMGVCMHVLYVCIYILLLVTFLRVHTFMT